MSTIDKLKEGTPMPARDRTGPMGEGPMTGRGMGDCGGRGRGRGRGWGPGRGRGWGPAWDYGVPAPHPDPEQEAASLRSQSSRLKEQLENIERRLAEFEKNKVVAELIVIKGAGHGFQGKDGKRASSALVAWFEKHLAAPQSTSKAE